MKKLLIIDLQKQFIDRNGEYHRILKELNSLKNNYDDVYATVFSQTIEDSINPNFHEKLNWDKCMHCSIEDLEFSIQEDHVIIKNGYGIKNIEKYFSENDEINIMGCCSEACVMAICFQFWDLGYNFNILTDYVYTTASENVDKNIKKIFKINFGKCTK